MPGLPLDQRANALAEFVAFTRTGVIVLWIGLITLAALPALAALSALAFRGGARHRLTGVEVVRLDGRPAGRLRCAWRALVAWAPPFALLVAARYLEDTYWRGWAPGADATLTTITVPALQVLAYALIALFLLVAVLQPARGLHDRLAGTCLVPA
jgi:hypothetical protein